MTRSSDMGRIVMSISNRFSSGGKISGNGDNRLGHSINEMQLEKTWGNASGSKSLGEVPGSL